VTWFRTVPEDSLAVEAGVRVNVGGASIAIFCTESGLRAVGDRCSHAEASLSEGEVFGDEVECPRHGATFDLTTGAALTLPASTPVPVYPVRVTDGVIEVEVGT